MALIDIEAFRRDVIKSCFDLYGSIEGKHPTENTHESLTAHPYVLTKYDIAICVKRARISHQL